MSEVSLKPFYNIGRLWIKFHCGLRVSWIELDHDRSWIKTEDGYHCKVCGKTLPGRLKLFCSSKCEYFFEVNYHQIKTWDTFRLNVLINYDGKCAICKKVIATKDSKGYWPSDVKFVCDHIIPLFKGGRDWWEDPLFTNFQPLCEDCNKVKTAKDVRNESKPMESPFGVSLGDVFWFKENYGGLDRFLNPLISVDAEEKIKG